MAADSASANGHRSVTRAEHEDLRALVNRRFDEQAEQLAHLADQVKLIGTAIELLLKAHGLDGDE